MAKQYWKCLHNGEMKMSAKVETAAEALYSIFGQSVEVAEDGEASPLGRNKKEAEKLFEYHLGKHKHNQIIVARAASDEERYAINRLHEIVNTRDARAKFITDVAMSPCNAIKWYAEDAMVEEMQAKWAETALKRVQQENLNPFKVVRESREHFRDRLEWNEWRHNSTSIGSNFTNEATRSAACRWLRTVGAILAHAEGRDKARIELGVGPVDYDAPYKIQKQEAEEQQ